MRGDFVKRAQEDVIRAAERQTVRHRAGLAIAMPAAGFIAGGQHLDLRQDLAQVIDQLGPRHGTRVHRQGKPEAGGQEVLGDEAQPAQMMPLGAGLIEQQMPVRTHARSRAA